MNKDNLYLNQILKKQNNLVTTDIITFWTEYREENKIHDDLVIIGSKIELTQKAEIILLNYFKKSPYNRAKENTEHSIDPLLHPIEYFRSEVSIEPEHFNILLDIRSNNGIVNCKIVRDWIVEENKDNPIIF